MSDKSEKWSSKILNSDIQTRLDCFRTNWMPNNWDVDVMVHRANDTSYFKQVEFQTNGMSEKETGPYTLYYILTTK